jgi:hypothetical protein
MKLPVQPILSSIANDRTGRDDKHAPVWRILPKKRAAQQKALARWLLDVLSSDTSLGVAPRYSSCQSIACPPTVMTPRCKLLFRASGCDFKYRSVRPGVYFGIPHGHQFRGRRVPLERLSMLTGGNVTKPPERIA